MSATRKILHDYQSRTIEALRESRRRGNRRIACALPTGGGKGVIMAHMAWNNMVIGGGGSLLTAPRKELVRQNGKQLWDHGLRAFGTIRGGVKPSPTMPVQVATVQALVARRFVPKANLILVDECHMRSELLDGLMRDPAYARVTFVGFSATPWRKGMGQYWDDLVIGATTQELIDGGFLVPFETYEGVTGQCPDLSGIRTVVSEYGPDFQKGALAEAMSKPKLVADVVETHR
jgi:superfamily II DNA or RNA helicase